jgi:glycerate-2-kinase
VTKDGYAGTLARFRVRETGHPVPDARSERAGREALGLVEGAQARDALVVLLSGGASSLLVCPAAGLALDDVAATTSALLRSAAPIDELNAVRKHLSAASGGLLGRRARCARIDVLAVSDVPGDRVDLIGSGPFAPDPSTFADALAVLERRGLRNEVPSAVRAHLEAGARGEVEDTPKPGGPELSRVRTTVLASNATALVAASAEAQRLGLRPLVVQPEMTGEASRVGRNLASLGAAVWAGPDVRPRMLLAGGETTVTVRGDGQGGRNQELALAAAIQLDGCPGVSLLAAGTDGTDGPTDAAGAFVDGTTAASARTQGIDPREALRRNDSYRFFSRAGGVLVTGPTRTNVMDLVLLSIGSGATAEP